MANSQKAIVNSQTRGFIALTSVVIIGAVIVLLIIGIFKGAVGEMERGEAKEKSEQALSLANLCMETALNELRQDFAGYGGDEIITVGGEECYISSVNRASGTIVETEGEFAGYTKKTQAEVEQVSGKIEIIGWGEIE